MNITEDYVSFETAKLLKEKGIDISARQWYDENGNVSQKYIKLTRDILGKDRHFARPTLQQVMKLLRKKYGVILSIEPSINGYCSLTYKDGTLITNLMSDEEYTYEQACEAGINYFLKNMIETDFGMSCDKHTENTVKWKKAKRNLNFNKHIVINEKDRVSLTTEVYKGEYYIDPIDLLKLPKEE